MAKSLAQKEANFLKFGKVNPTFFDRIKAIPSLFASSNNAILPPSMFDTFRYIQYGFGYTLPDWDKVQAVQQGYSLNGMVYSIVKKIAKTASYAPWGIYKVVNEQELKRYKALSVQPHVDYATLRISKIKALKPTTDSKLQDLMTYPNPEQTFSDLIETLVGFKLITGDCYLWADLLDAGNNIGKPQGWYSMPSQYMQIITDGYFPLGVAGYMLNNIQELKFRSEEIMHSKYWNPNWEYIGSQLYGFSPLQAAFLAVQQDNDSKTAAIEILQNRGVRGVLAMDSLANASDKLAAEQAGRLKERWNQSNLANRGAIIPIAGSAKWVNIGLTAADMKILEIGQYTKEQLCNIYGVSSILFNDMQSATLDNYKVARKDFISNCVLNELNDLRDDLNRKLQSDWGYKNSGIVLDYDSSVYSELNEDIGDMVTWLNTAWWLEPNLKRQYMNEVVSDDPAMNKIYAPNTLVPLDDLGFSVPSLPSNASKGYE